MIQVFKENLNLQLPLIFYGSIKFVFETIFISGQIVENRFGAILGIGDKFITDFNVFSYIVLQFSLGLNSLENSKTISYDFKNSSSVVLLERSQFVLQKLGMKLLEMGKDMKIQHSVSSPPYKVQRNFFCKKDLCLGNKRFRKNLWGDVLHEDE